MTTISTWLGLVGAWLLFAGPVYQAALELRDHAMAHDHVAVLKKAIPRVRTSWLWWLVPPVHMWLERRRSKAYAHAFLTALPNEDVAPLLSFLDKATGWMYVAGGGALLATKETLVWVRTEQWPPWIGFAIAFTLLAGCLGVTIVRTRATKRRVELYGNTPDARRPASE